MGKYEDNSEMYWAEEDSDAAVRASYARQGKPYTNLSQSQLNAGRRSTTAADMQAAYNDPRFGNRNYYGEFAEARGRANRAAQGRGTRAVAAEIVKEELEAATSRHDGVVISVQTGTATVQIGASPVDVAGVPIVSGLTLAAGQVVVVEFVGQAPRVASRLQ